MNIYELTAEYARLKQVLEHGLESAEDEAEVLDALNAVQDSFTEKAEGYARIRNNMLAEADASRAEEKRLAANRRAIENGIERLERNIFESMKATGQASVKTTIGAWKVQKNPWSVTVQDIAKIPARFLIEQPPTVDKRAMLDEFKQSGEIFDGVQIAQTEGLRFR